jgi:TRAP transporter TAXI family solute receptor
VTKHLTATWVRRDLISLWLVHVIALVMALAVGCDKKDVEATPRAEPSASSPPASGATLRILTGSKSGNYYKAAQELAEAMGGALVLDVVESAGSFSNIGQLGTGKSDLAIAQFDALKVFLKLGNKRAKMAQSSLVLAPLGLEYVHILVSQKSGIESVADLKGKRICVGPMHSGSWISAWSVMFHMNEVNIEKADHIFKLEYEEALEKLMSGELDALFVTTAPGMPVIAELGAAAATKIGLLSLADDFEIPEGARGSYLLESIPAGTYPFRKEEVRTLATPSYVLGRADLDSALVKTLAAAIYAPDGALRKKSDMWRHATKERVQQDLDNKVPYHPGVREYLGL